MPRRIEDLYDPPAPVEVVLFGGPHDGQRITIPWGGQTTPPLKVEMDEELAPPNLASIFDDWRSQVRRRAAYRWNGSILDDGARVYQVIP